MNNPKPMRERLRDALLPKAEAGDLRAITALLEMDREETAPNSFSNIQVNIAPYTIKDTSLAEIVARAYTPHVMEALEGLRLRMEQDEAPHEMRDLFDCFCRQYETWAEKEYAPADA